MAGGATSGTATVISSLPYSDTDTSPSFAGLWYVYTPPTSLIGVVGGLVASAVAGFETQVYSPDAVTVYPPGFVAAPKAKPFQIPVVAGTPVYFNVTNQIGVYTFSLDASPTDTAPVGSIWVNDDHDGYPLALLSAVDGTVLHFVSPFPNGENADVIAAGTHTGRILVHDRADDHLKLYSPVFDLLADLAYTSTGDPKYPIRTNSTLSTFYVGQPIDPNHGNLATVTTVTSAGAFGPTTWVLPDAGLTGIAPNAAETILYHAGQGGNAINRNGPVGRWDLVHNVALTDLAPGLGLSWDTRFDLLVLADDTIVVSYQAHDTTSAPVFKHYATDGTVLDTWTVAGARSVDVHLAYAIDDPVSFWIWTKNAGVSTFINLRVSDGTAISTITPREFELGVWLGTAPAPPPPVRFGHSESCPFLILRVAVPPVGTVTGTIAASMPTTTSPEGTQEPLEADLTGYVLPPRHPPCPTV